MKELTICVPAYNEEMIIGETLNELKKEFPNSEIIVVNDGSTDKTEEVARLVPGIIVLSHETNRGYGASLKTAMVNAKREIVVWYDADGQHRVTDLRGLVQPVLEHKKDVVIGVRIRGSNVKAERMFGKYILKLIAEFIVRQKLPDLNSGLRCFRLDIIKRYLHLLPNRFSASSISTILMIKRGYRIGYSDIKTQERVGKSTVKIFKDGLKAIQLLIRILILFEAFGFFTILSLLQIIPGLIYGLYIAFKAHKGFPTLASTIIISGILTFFMGIICDQITELRKEKFEDYGT